MPQAIFKMLALYHLRQLHFVQWELHYPKQVKVVLLRVREREEDLGISGGGLGDCEGVLSMIRAWSGSFIIGLDGPFI